MLMISGGQKRCRRWCWIVMCIQVVRNVHKRRLLSRFKREVWSLWDWTVGRFARLCSRWLKRSAPKCNFPREKATLTTEIRKSREMGWRNLDRQRRIKPYRNPTQKKAQKRKKRNLHQLKRTSLSLTKRPSKHPNRYSETHSPLITNNQYQKS